MMNGKKLARGGAVALVALGLATTPAFADEIEAEEVIVAEVVEPPAAKPCPECAVNNGSVSFSIDNDFTNAYFFRGILQEKNGLMWQPAAEVNWAVWQAGEGDQTGISDVTLTLGTWNSVNTNKTGSRRDGSGPGNWYESDIYAGVSMGTDMGLSAGATYVAYTSPANAFGTVQEIDLDVAFDDSGLYGGEMDDMGFATNPYLLFGFEVDKTRFGKDEGTYMEAGIEPEVTVMQSSDYPVTIGMPLTVGISLDNYYLPNDNPDGSNPGDDTFGYASAGLGVAVPLSFIPARLGAFSAGVSGRWLALGSNLQRINTGVTKNPAEGRFGEWIGVASVNWSY